MAQYALLDSEGNVVNIIEAEQEFIDQLPSLIADPEVNTGSLPQNIEAIPTAGFDEPGVRVPRPEVGGRRDENGIFVPPGGNDAEVVDAGDEAPDDMTGDPRAEQAQDRPTPADDRPAPPGPADDVVVTDPTPKRPRR